MYIMQTENMYVLKGLYEEYGLNFRSYKDMVMCMVNNLKMGGKKGTAIVFDNRTAEKLGKEKVKIATTAIPVSELPAFSMLCDDAWPGGNRILGAKRQREYFELPFQYERSYMEKLKNDKRTKISYSEYQGLTKEVIDAQKQRPFHFAAGQQPIKGVASRDLLKRVSESVGAMTAKRFKEAEQP